MAGKHYGSAAYAADGSHPAPYPGGKENIAWGEGRTGQFPVPADATGAAAYTAGVIAASDEEAANMELPSPFTARLFVGDLLGDQSTVGFAKASYGRISPPEVLGEEVTLLSSADSSNLHTLVISADINGSNNAAIIFDGFNSNNQIVFTRVAPGVYQQTASGLNDFLKAAADGAPVNIQIKVP